MNIPRHLSSSAMRLIVITTFAILLNSVSSGIAQQACVRIMEQDSTLNNLSDPTNYETAMLGTLANVLKRGTGENKMIIIPGLGFSGGIFNEFMALHEADFTMFAVTLPGMGGTPAPSTPSLEISFGDQTWTNGALEGLERLMKDEQIEDAVIVGHWMTGTQLALRLALEHPDQVAGVILISGTPFFFPTDTTNYPARPELPGRIAYVDKGLAPHWFKTVTRETWDDNNFLPGDYAINPVRGLRLWREAAEPPLHVWIRYLCEFYSQDIGLDLDKLTVPTLLLKPGFENLLHDPGNNYMFGFCHTAWDHALPANSEIDSLTIPNSRVCMWFDQPEQFNAEVDKFLKRIGKS